MINPSISLTSIDGISVGHASDHGTGCTAILCPEGFTPGVYMPGFAPASREVELMRAENTVDKVHGIMLAGGSAFGLNAAAGLIRFLQEQGKGLEMPNARIPLVPCAAIYDLDINQKPGFLPDPDMGYAAAKNATNAPLTGNRTGRVGAGTGALCGRMGMPSPAGIGSCGIEHNGIKIAALSVLNSLGSVYDQNTGTFIAGAQIPTPDGNIPMTLAHLCAFMAPASPAAPASEGSGPLPTSNTILTVVATNVPLSKLQTNRLARMASSGIARVVRPAHMLFDGDIVFALSSTTGPQADENLLAAMAAEVVANSIMLAAQA